MRRLYREIDANLLHLQGLKVALIGYGNLGRPVALNLRDSGAQVIVGNIQDAFGEAARHERFEVYPISNAIRQAQIIFLALPDEALPQIYLRDIGPHLKRGDMLIFAAGYNIAYKYVEPPNFVDVGLIAPRSLAANLRQAYLSGAGYPAYLALHQQATPQAQDRLLAVALALGALKLGAMEVSFQQEALLDLFWQQAVLPAIHQVLLTATQVLGREGLPPEWALTELYLSGELGAFFQQAALQGLRPTLKGFSLTAQYGFLSRTERFQETKVQHHMEGILEAIRNGDFAREWASEYIDGYPRLARLEERLVQTSLWSQEAGIVQYLRGREEPPT
jgi:ketol-acid reductoisomerase